MGGNKITIILENRSARIILTGIVVGKLIEFNCSHFIKKNPEMFKDYIDKHPELSPKPTKTTESKITLKKYYESVSEANSLFQLKGYSIKYETIRRNKLYQQLKF